MTEQQNIEYKQSSELNGGIEVTVYNKQEVETPEGLGDNETGGQDRLVEGLVEGLVESQQKIVQIMIDNPAVTIKEMSETVGISTTSIDKNITTLKKKGIVRRVGSDSKGTWKINFPDKE